MCYIISMKRTHTVHTIDEFEAMFPEIDLTLLKKNIPDVTELLIEIAGSEKTIQFMWKEQS